LELEAFILIGGRSTRFGSDKAFVEYEGETLASRAVRTVEAAFPGMRVTFVASHEDQFGIRALELDKPLVSDVRKGFGGWSGLDAALSHARAEWTLVFACDLPFVTAEFLRALSKNALEEVDAVIPRQPDGQLQPLCAIYRTKIVRPVVTKTIDDGGHLPPLASLCDGVRSALVTAGSDILRNVNTPSELA
jgi:molybdopterin-guanine dinucleotide biosynthesis protein A